MNREAQQGVRPRNGDVKQTPVATSCAMAVDADEASIIDSVPFESVCAVSVYRQVQSGSFTPHDSRCVAGCSHRSRAQADGGSWLRLARLSLRLASRPERESISNPNLFAAAIRQTTQLFSGDLATAILCEQDIVKY